MAKATLPSILKATLTQGSADAFIQASVTTGLVAGDGKVLQVDKLQLVVPDIVLDNSQVQVCMTHKSLSAMPSTKTVDAASIFYWERWVNAAGAAFLAYEDLAPFIEFDEDELLILGETLYVQADTAATTAANTIYLKMWCQLKTMSEVEKNAALVAQLG